MVKKIYGPYVGKDNRKRVVLLLENGKLTTKSYARFLLGDLSSIETADHIDENKSNDDISNLQILSLTDNIKKNLLARNIFIPIEFFDCPICASIFYRELRVIKHNQNKQGKEGPFCSRSCAGKFNA